MGPFTTFDAEVFVVEEELGDAHDGVGAPSRRGAFVAFGRHIEGGGDGFADGLAAFGVEVAVEGVAVSDRRDMRAVTVGRFAVVEFVGAFAVVADDPVELPEVPLRGPRHERVFELDVDVLVAFFDAATDRACR